MIVGNNKTLLQKVFQVSSKKNMIFVTTNSYFICSEDSLNSDLLLLQDNHSQFVWPKKSVQWFENKYLYNSGLKIGKIMASENKLNREKAQGTLFDLKKNILKTHRDALFYYLKNLYDFLKTIET